MSLDMVVPDDVFRTMTEERFGMFSEDKSLVTGFVRDLVADSSEQCEIPLLALLVSDSDARLDG